MHWARWEWIAETASSSWLLRKLKTNRKIVNLNDPINKTSAFRYDLLQMADLLIITSINNDLWSSPAKIRCLDGCTAHGFKAIYYFTCRNVWKSIKYPKPIADVIVKRVVWRTSSLNHSPVNEDNNTCNSEINAIDMFKELKWKILKIWSKEMIDPVIIPRFICSKMP